MCVKYNHNFRTQTEAKQGTGNGLGHKNNCPKVDYIFVNL